MAGEQVRDGFRREAQRVGEVMLTLDEADFERPTECPPWTVKELFAHVHGAVARIETMVAGPAWWSWPCTGWTSPRRCAATPG